MARDPILDAWRGVAVLLVIGSHAFIHWRELTGWALYAGVVGVQIFFVLSGYIITKLLLTEEQVSLRGFYVRRAFRIVPPLLLLLVFLEALNLAGLAKTEGLWFVRGTFFACNFYSCGVSLGHLWTLAVEEQFYLVWPLILVLTPRRYLAKIAGALSIAFILAAPFYLFAIGPSSAEAYSCLAAGASVAASQRLRKWLMAMPWPVMLAAAALLIGAPLGNKDALAQLLMAGFLAILVFGSYRFIDSGSRLTGALSKVGLVSYGLYLYQQPFLYGKLWGWEWAFVPMAVVSYFLVEKPLIRLGRRLSQTTKSPQPEGQGQAA